MTPIEPARRPPPGLPGLDADWSRLVTAVDGDGIERRWHVLDRGPDDARLTLLCVHGNPSWSFLFRALLRDAPADVRVVAIDHLDMGWSDRTGTTRRLATRIDDLGTVTDALGITGPVVTVAHDWGGPISLGWVAAHRAQVRGVVLMNTAVHQPAGSPAPAVIRLARRRALLRPVTTATTAFIRGAFELTADRPPPPVRSAYLAPYATAERRAAIGDFVADIPLDPDHPSAATLDEVAAGLADLADTPVLLLWGAADRVFSDRYLHDLEARLPHADVHRYPRAGHFVSEDTDCLAAALDWVETLDDRDEQRSIGVVGDRARAGDRDPSQLTAPTFGWPSVVEPNGTRIDGSEFERRVGAAARALVAGGVAAGDRVALMVPPGVDLSVMLLACWRAAAVVVLVDDGLGARGIAAAVRSANPDHIVGIPRALAAARAMRWPGRRIGVGAMAAAQRTLLGVDAVIEPAADAAFVATAIAELPSAPTAGDIAAVAFTSGATGPSKGVVYTHAALAAQRDAIADTYEITAADRLVAAFAPFALFGPLLGITSTVPEMNAPGTLTAASLADAVADVDATLVFASPAALTNVARTAADLTAAQRAACRGVRLVLSAGAPVAPDLLAAAGDMFPAATAATPYGMTECLPVSSITLDEILDAGTGDGVCVGRPVAGVDVRLQPLTDDGQPHGDLTTDTDVVGEFVVAAPHRYLRYDRLWHTTHRARPRAGWHATGDVGRLDAGGRLWVGGRTGHVIATAAGHLTPVAIERAAESVDGVDLAAAVGVGPTGTAQVVVIVQPSAPPATARLADTALADRVRAACDVPIAAVLEVAAIPVDRRHNSKIDRTRLAMWADGVLAGGRMTDP